VTLSWPTARRARESIEREALVRAEYGEREEKETHLRIRVEDAAPGFAWQRAVRNMKIHLSHVLA